MDSGYDLRVQIRIHIISNEEPQSLEINHWYYLGRGLPESKYVNQKKQRFTPPPNIRQNLDQLPKEEFNLLPGLTPFSKSWNVGNYA